MALVVWVEDPGAATQLAREFVREGIDARPETGVAPPGSKSGGAVTAGLIVSGLLSAPMIQAVAQIVLARLRRGQPGAITFVDGERELTIENASAETERALVDWITDRKD